MTSQDFESLMDKLLAHIEAFAVDNDTDAVGPFRSFLMRNPNVVMLIREREYDTHNRVRLSYDKTVADSWSAEVARRGERIAKLERLILDAERSGAQYTESEELVDACPWCWSSMHGDVIEHDADCPAFASPGEVRR